MSQLKIALLGELQISSVDNDGRSTPIQLSSTEVLSGLLAALVFYPEITGRVQIAKQMYDEEAVNLEPRRYRDRIYQQSRRLKTKLRSPDLFTTGTEQLKLLGRTQTAGQPRPLLIDWDLFQEARDAERHAEAVSLVRAEPLPSVDDETAEIGQFVSFIREELRRGVADSLGKLGLPIPEPLVLGEHLPDGFEYRFPEEWAQSAYEPQPEVSSPPTATGRPRRRIKLLGAFEPNQLFEGCPEGERRLGEELRDAEERGASLWWSDGSKDWFGRYFAFWSKAVTTPCGQVAITYSGDDRYDSARFGVIPPQDGGNEKAVLIEASTMFSEDTEELLCGKTTWRFAHEKARKDADELLDSPPWPSVFGVTDRPAYPGIVGVHTLMQTRDGYLLFAQRDSHIGFYKLMWSASFEESVSVKAREFTGPHTGDKTVLDTIVGGLYEEWGVDDDAVADSTCLAIGREWVREDDCLELHSSVLAAVRLSITLEEVWACLDEAPYIRDRHEHRAWAGCHFSTRDDVLRFVAAARDCKEGKDLLSELCRDVDTDLRLYPGGRATHLKHRGLMPTSAARLVLGSAWLWALPPLDDAP